MKKVFYNFSLVFMLSASLIAANNSPTATISVVNKPAIVQNNDILNLAGEGFAPQDQIKFVTISLIDRDSRLISEIPLTQYSLSVDSDGRLSGNIKIEGIPYTATEIIISTYAQNSNVLGSDRIAVIGDDSNSGINNSIRAAGTVAIFDSAVAGQNGNGDGIADNSEDIDLEGSGWTGSLFGLAQREFSDLAASVFVTSTAISDANASISGGNLTGYTTTTASYDASTKTIRIRVVNDAFETADSDSMRTPDTDPPGLASATATALDTILLTFDEPVNETNNAHSNFSFGGTQGGSVTAGDLIAVGSQPTDTWKLFLSSGLPNRGVGDVTIAYNQSSTDSLSDAAGNQVEDTSPDSSIADSIPPNTTTLRDSSNSVALSIGEFIGSSTYLLRARVADGNNDTSLDSVRFEGSDNGSSWTRIGADATPTVSGSDADFETSWDIQTAGKFKVLRAHAFDNNGNETNSAIVGSTTDGTNDNFEDTYRSIITDVVPDTIGASSGSVRAAVIVGYQNNYGDAVNTMGFDITFVIAETTTTSETWWPVSSGGSGSSTQINLTVASSVTEDTVWYSNNTAGGPNDLSLTESGNNFSNNNGVVDANGETVVVTVSDIVTVSNPDPGDDTNIDTTDTAGDLTLDATVSGGEDSGALDDFRIIWGFSTSSTQQSSYTVQDTSGDLTPPGGGGTISHTISAAGLKNLGAAYDFMYWWVENLSTDPDATVLDGEPIKSDQVRLIINPNLVTEGGIGGGDVSGSSLAVGQSNQELVSIKFTSNPTAAIIQIAGLVFDITSSSTADINDISTFHLYKDGGTLGEFNSGLDQLLDDVTYGGGNSVNFNNIDPDLNVTGTTDYVLVTVDIKSGANPDHELGLKLSNPTSITLADNVDNGPATSINIDTFSDLGTSADVPLPVELSTFAAKAGYGKIIIQWETASELDNEGFYLYRSQKPDHNFEQLNLEIIPGNGNTNTSHTYSYTDKDVEENETYYYKLISRDFNGEMTTYGSIVSATVLEAPRTFKIAQNYPNPFNPETHFTFSIAEPSQASLRIYNVLGQKIRTIFDNRFFDVGVYEDFSWDASDDSGNQVANGIYYYVFQVPDQNVRQVKKMVFLK